MKAKSNPPIQTQIAELDEAVEWFYSDDFNLEQATAKYQAAFRLAGEIEQNLLKLKNQVEILPEDFTKA